MPEPVVIILVADDDDSLIGTASENEICLAIKCNCEINIKLNK